jgi:hypothetical protein
LCRRILPTRQFAGGHRYQQCISLGTDAAPGLNLENERKASEKAERKLQATLKRLEEALRQ